MHASRHQNIFTLLAATVVLLGLSGCGAGMDELDQYINEVKARPGGRIAPLPEIKPYETFSYVADVEQLRSPFLPAVPENVGVPGRGGPGPVEDRIKEDLESYPLDSLTMVGSMALGGTDHALIQTSDGLIYRVVPGNYLGQNDGRIIQIADSAIEIVEIIPDGIGGYIERQAAISLSD